MRAAIAAVAFVCLGAVSMSGCGQSGQPCGVQDFGGGGTSGYQTPQQALQSVLARHEQWLSLTGWKLTEGGAHIATFTSGNATLHPWPR
jgi:hypothetical protein